MYRNWALSWQFSNRRYSHTLIKIKTLPAQSEAAKSVPKAFYKKGVLKNSQNWQENTCARVTFLIKLQAWSLWHKCFPVSLKNTFFHRTPLETASGQFTRSCSNSTHTAWNVSKYGVFFWSVFSDSDWIRRDTPYLSVFSPNAGKNGPEKTLHLDTFHAVTVIREYLLDWPENLKLATSTHLEIFRDIFRSNKQNKIKQNKN